MENKINLRNMYISKIQKQIAKLSSSTKLLDKLNINIIQTGGNANATEDNTTNIIEAIKDKLINEINKKLDTIDNMQTSSHKKMLDIYKKKLANAGSKTNEEVDALQKKITELTLQQNTNRNNLENVNKNFIKTLKELMLKHSQINIDNLIKIIKDITNEYINEKEISENVSGIPDYYIDKILNKFKDINIKGYSDGIINMLEKYYKKVADLENSNIIATDVNINDENINDENINEYIKDNIFTSEKYKEMIDEIENDLKKYASANDRKEYDTFYENYLGLKEFYNTKNPDNVKEELKYFGIDVDTINILPDTV